MPLFLYTDDNLAIFLELYIYAGVLHTIQGEITNRDIFSSQGYQQQLDKHVYSSIKKENFCKYFISPTYNFV